MRGICVSITARCLSHRTSKDSRCWWRRCASLAVFGVLGRPNTRGKLAGCLISLAGQSTTPSFHSSMFDDNIERDQRPACLRAGKKRLFDLVLQSPAGTIPAALPLAA